MKKIVESRYILLMLLFYCGMHIFSEASPQNWSNFGGDIYHKNHLTVQSCALGCPRVWYFQPNEHPWDYQPKSSVWSSPALANIDGIPMIFIGSYDNNLYAVNAVTGIPAWRFTTGGGVHASPVITNINGTPTVIIASTVRTIYAVDARNGDKLWSYSVLEWRYTVADGIMSTPAVTTINDNNTPTVFVGCWINDRNPVKNIQQGLVIAIDCRTGNKLWHRVLSSCPLTSPVVTTIDNNTPAVIIGGNDGNLYVLNAVTGELLWKYTTGDQIHSSPAIAYINNIQIVFIGSRDGYLYAIDLTNRTCKYRFKTGYWVDSSPMIAEVDGTLTVFVGSYDRCLYAIAAATGKKLWSYQTDSAVYSTPSFLRIGNIPLVFIHSLDNHLYSINAKTGELYWKRMTGKLIWDYTDLGDSIWSSPVTATINHISMVFFGSYDGVLYAIDAQKAAINYPDDISSQFSFYQVITILFLVLIATGLAKLLIKS